MAIADIVRISILLFLNFLLGACGFCPLSGDDEASLAGNSFVVRDVRVFDGRTVVEHTNVVVSNGRVTAVTRGASPAGLPVVDGSGRTLVAGSVAAKHQVLGDRGLYGRSANSLQLTDRGRVAPGTPADLVLVEGNPLRGTDAECDVARVFLNGFDTRHQAHMQ